MHIREERTVDHSRISRIQYAAFKDHPMHPPGAEPTEHRIVSRLRDSDDLTLSLLAEVVGEDVGHIALSPTIVGGARSGWFLLGPAGVLPAMQGKGIGSALVRESLERMRLIGADGVVLVGDPGFYARFGFASLRGLTYPGVPDQYVLAVAFGSAAPRGEVIPHEVFRVPTK